MVKKTPNLSHHFLAINWGYGQQILKPWIVWTGFRRNLWMTGSNWEVSFIIEHGIQEMWGKDKAGFMWILITFHMTGSWKSSLRKHRTSPRRPIFFGRILQKLFLWYWSCHRETGTSSPAKPLFSARIWSTTSPCTMSALSAPGWTICRWIFSPESESDNDATCSCVPPIQELMTSTSRYRSFFLFFAKFHQSSTQNMSGISFVWTWSCDDDGRWSPLDGSYSL